MQVFFLFFWKYFSSYYMHTPISAATHPKTIHIPKVLPFYIGKTCGIITTVEKFYRFYKKAKNR